MYILAGKKKLADVRAKELQQAMDKAKASGLPEDAQAARDLSDQCERFEKKLYDLELTRNISLQMGPQIRLLQNNNSMMAEKIQSTIVNTCLLYTSTVRRSYFCFSIAVLPTARGSPDRKGSPGRGRWHESAERGVAGIAKR